MPESASGNTGGTAGSTLRDKVVVQYGTHALRGYTDRSLWDPASLEASGQTPPVLPEVGGELVTMSLPDIKAVFFVKAFEGAGHEPIHFHSNVPHKGALWVRVIFQDGEEVEGMVPNSHELLSHNTMTLTMSDPDSNNIVAIFSKRMIRQFQVLGLR